MQIEAEGKTEAETLAEAHRQKYAGRDMQVETEAETCR